ncbi:MAG TPA: hypothetical protein VJB59_06550 [Bdellovibrionota bacterium]|nr:hypothetical protein [Bdellovibrionota bacterium]
MQSKAALSRWLSNAGDYISEQAWFQQIKSKWDEFDQQSKTYLRLGFMAGVVLLVLAIVMSSMAGVYRLKKELRTKSDLLRVIESANDELKRLQGVTSRASGAASTQGPWSAYVESTAGNYQIDRSALTISPEKPAPSSSGSEVKETLLDITLKHVNIRQVILFAFGLESGPRPVKLRNLQIDTKNDPSGYMDATFSISAFSLASK